MVLRVNACFSLPATHLAILGLLLLFLFQEDSGLEGSCGYSYDSFETSFVSIKLSIESGETSTSSSSEAFLTGLFEEGGVFTGDGGRVSGDEMLPIETWSLETWWTSFNKGDGTNSSGFAVDASKIGPFGCELSFNRF